MTYFRQLDADSSCGIDFEEFLEVIYKHTAQEPNLVASPAVAGFAKLYEDSRENKSGCKWSERYAPNSCVSYLSPIHSVTDIPTHQVLALAIAKQGANAPCLSTLQRQICLLLNTSAVEPATVRLAGELIHKRHYS